jgi:hypothetical protein
VVPVVASVLSEHLRDFIQRITLNEVQPESLLQERRLSRIAGTKNVTNAHLRLSMPLLLDSMKSGERQRPEHENLCNNS